MSFLDGQVTFFSSDLTLVKNSLVFPIIDNRPHCSVIDKVGRPGGTRTPNTRIWSPVLYQFELLACMKNLSPFSHPCLLGFLVRRMLTTEPAILVELQLVGSILLIFSGRIIPLLALGARKSDNVTHNLNLIIPSRPKPGGTVSL